MTDAPDRSTEPCADGHQWGLTDEDGRSSCARCGMDRGEYESEGRRPARLSDDIAPLAGNLREDT